MAPKSVGPSSTKTFSQKTDVPNRVTRYQFGAVRLSIFRLSASANHEVIGIRVRGRVRLLTVNLLARMTFSRPFGSSVDRSANVLDSQGQIGRGLLDNGSGGGALAASPVLGRLPLGLLKPNFFGGGGGGGFL